MGSVVKRRLETDGDWHVLLWVDAPYQGLLTTVLNEEDNWQGAVALVLEIVPDCRDRPASAAAAVHCPRSPVPVPALQQHIEVWGAWVLDLQHGGHAELHPVWSWRTV